MIVSAQQITGINSAPPTPNERVPMKTLGQNEFLELLVTQMRNQDPMKPMSDTEFIAQMAEFSNLEQTKAMSSDITKLRQGNDFQQGTGLLGRYVRLSLGDSGFTNGVVTDLDVKDGEARIIVGDKAYTLDQVTAVRAESPETEEQTTTE
ncbi:MAG: flagellar hook capping FlgD N-terminal domain-containing protein [Verrucomicrobiota bacterium]|nr:flagellar hook capping FlgD N-terminal domain-containing protein [Verrucomicrobiota bacterium]